MPTTYRIRTPDKYHDLPENFALVDVLAALAVAAAPEGEPFTDAHAIALNAILPPGVRIVAVSEHVPGEDAPQGTPAAPTAKRDRRTKVEVAADRAALVDVIKSGDGISIGQVSIRYLSSLVGRDVDAIYRDLRGAAGITSTGDGGERVYRVSGAGV